MCSGRYELRIHAAARRSLVKIPGRYAWALLQSLRGPLCDRPHRVGKLLSLDLEGWRAMRVGDFRVVYWIDEHEPAVVVERIEHRADVYRPR
jgi:mRNA interferase RelE/StbE